RAALENLRSQADDLHEALGAQLASDRAEDTGADRLVFLVDEDGRVAVELDEAAVRTGELALGADDDRARDFTLLDLGARNRLADRDDHDVADRGVATAAAAEHLDAVDLLGAAVVSDVEDRSHLDHD